MSIFVGSEAPAAHLQPLANDAEPTGDDALDGEPLTEMVEMDGNVDGEPLDVDGEHAATLRILNRDWCLRGL